MPELLSDLVREAGPQPVDAVVRWSRQLATAIDDAHGRGAARFQVRPEKVLISDEGEAQFTDISFGSATEDGASSDPKSISDDIYQLASTIYIALDGTTRFAGVFGGAVPNIDRDDVAPAMMAALAKSLSPTAEQRHPTASALADELEIAARPTMWPKPERYERVIGGPDEEGHWDDDIDEADRVVRPAPPRPEMMPDVSLEQLVEQFVGETVPKPVAEDKPKPPRPTPPPAPEAIEEFITPPEPVEQPAAQFSAVAVAPADADGKQSRTAVLAIAVVVVLVIGGLVAWKVVGGDDTTKVAAKPTTTLAATTTVPATTTAVPPTVTLPPAGENEAPVNPGATFAVTPGDEAPPAAIAQQLNDAAQHWRAPVGWVSDPLVVGDCVNRVGSDQHKWTKVTCDSESGQVLAIGSREQLVVDHADLSQELNACLTVVISTTQTPSSICLVPHERAQWRTWLGFISGAG